MDTSENGQQRSNVMQDTTMRGINPKTASYEEVTRNGSSTGREVTVARAKVHNFNRGYMRRIFDQLARSEKREVED